ncbi:aminotransferase class I/II-fold pyridoxal phosphate-dependent enzyme [Pseudomonas putida]|uniref:Aminotransferase class I/II-fold pyridoxal phosphate-dependent enzyme n=1 Tax=Pseudomonas putida TaxID=303 RepID=A0A2Z4RQU2_PSEPU|nr:PLP-dependent aminotransferase family protein [Pseudomonas putida]AWY43376.1 aminotransferase class I/II-fold pyridoxal phosphate-dependent enzyme [Pseudomonas putida]
MELRIDRQAMVPVVQQIVDALVCTIHCNQMMPGTRLPSVRAIARINSLNEFCVVQACERLVAQGVLEPCHRAGYLVSAPASVVASDAGWIGDAEFDPCHSSCELQLGAGSLPDSWRESDDLAYAIREVSRTDMAGLFNYSSALGLPRLRQQIQKCLKPLDIHVEDSRILTTDGASQGLDLIVRTLLKPGDCVVVESPGCPVLFELLRLHGISMRQVPRTPLGPDLATLDELFAKHRPRAFFINSFHHNPTGTSLVPEVARQVLKLAREHDVLVIEDDVYADLHSSCGERLAALDENVIYVGSYSKTLSSALRVGFIVATAESIERLASVKMITSMGTSGFSESVLACLLANGAYRKLVQRQRQRLNNDRLALLQLLEDAEWEVFGKPVGGLFVWARSRMGDCAQVRAQARRCGIVLSSTTAFSSEGTVSDWQRINVACAGDPRARAFIQATTPDRPQAF